MADRIVQMIRVDQFDLPPQIRKVVSEEEQAGLAQSMREDGILAPVLAVPVGGRYIPLDGSRRIRAAPGAGFDSVPAVVVEGSLSEADVTRRQLILDAQRVNFNAVERAQGIRRLMELTGCAAGEVAVKIGISPAMVTKTLAVLDMAPEIQAQVAAGKIGLSTAYELARVNDATERERLTAEASAGRLTRDAVVKAKARTPRPPSRRNREAGSRRRRVNIGLGQGRSVAVSGPELTVQTLVAWLTELTDRLRRAAVEGRALGEVIKAISSK